MRKRLLFLVLVVFVIIMIEETESKKIPNPYKVLGIEKNANDEQIRQAFKKRSRKYHPDRNKKDPRAKQKFQQVVNAYQLLKDKEKRRIYDQTGEQDPQPQQGGGFPGGGFGFPGGGFGFPGGGFMNMEDMFGGGGFQHGHPGGFQQGHHGGFQQGHHQHQHQRQRRARRSRQRKQNSGYTFSYGGQQGGNFNFDL